jgi:hypothetical protein
VATPQYLLVTAAVALGLFTVGCGDGSDRDEDRVQIEALFEQMSSAYERGDARAACEVYSPESIDRAFITLDRCVQETEEVFERSSRAGEKPPRLEVADVSFADDRAKVELTGRTGEANLVETDGRWYLELVEEPPAELVPEDGEGG